MKRIGITQRVQNIESYDEKRDCLDQRWTLLAQELDTLLLPLPNLAMEQLPELLVGLKLDALILSGGNSLESSDYKGADIAPERDAFEAALIELALSERIPILGVCRGMQMINIHFGGKLIPIQNHVKTEHELYPLSVGVGLGLKKSVNSYHTFTIQREELAQCLKPIALDSEGNVEAFAHTAKPIFGIMWHPEREKPFDPSDMNLIRKLIL